MGYFCSLPVWRWHKGLQDISTKAFELNERLNTKILPNIALLNCVFASIYISLSLYKGALLSLKLLSPSFSMQIKSY